ncbi:MAG: amidohydrolase family protein, partial [Candidatus Hydrogenedentales bacterium]
PFVAGKAHPRGAGTFARVLGKYVREDGALTLMDALRKMTVLPAQRLENVAPQMKRKGRLQVGMDADIVVFNPDAVNARATYEDPAQPSAGIAHVIVAGTPVLRDGTLVEGAHPGQPITR